MQGEFPISPNRSALAAEMDRATCEAPPPIWAAQALGPDAAIFEPHPVSDHRALAPLACAPVGDGAETVATPLTVARPAAKDSTATPVPAPLGE